MKNETLLQFVDHTALNARTNWDEILTLCEESLKYHTASVCIPPNYIKPVIDKYKDAINVCTVVGFPLGYHVTEVKVLETQKALADGANEIDMVINITDIKNKNFSKISDEIRTLKKIVGDKILKVIIETCYLTEEEKIKMCHIVTETGADYIKTSTGFGSEGAVLEDIVLFKKYLGPNVKIKASGGIKTVEDLKKFIDAGCSRIGSSSAVRMICEEHLNKG